METSAKTYDKPAGLLTKPLQIGEFSCHANHGLELNSSNLRYLIHVDDDFEPLFDLDAGFKNHFSKNPKDYENDLVNLQQWAITERGKFNNDYKEVFRNAEMVCGRGTLTNIAQAPFYWQDPWRIVAIRYEDIIYLHNCGAIDGNIFAPPTDSRDAHRTYWGHSFRRIMTSKSPELAKLGCFDDSEVVDCRETYCAVQRSDIIKPNGERIKLAYYSEIKAVDSENYFVDFKTISSALYNKDTWLKKSWFWWLQCIFASVDRVHVGFKSDLGIVHNVRVVDRAFLHRHARKQCDIAFNFLTTVLVEVKKRCAVHETVEISYSPDSRKVHFGVTTKDDEFLLPHFTDRKIKFESW